MDYYPRRVGAISQLFAEPVSDALLGARHVHNHFVPRTEVICPKPRRAIRSPCFVDNVEMYNCKFKSSNGHRKDDGFDFLDIILGKDDLFFYNDTSEEEKFFCGSPPVRASNPIVHDVEFVKQSLSLTTQMGNLFSFSPRKEISTPCDPSYSDSPKVRIEGFASGSPDCRSVVSAHA